MNFLEIIIDGYNFLMTTGMLSPNAHESELEKGRRRLVQFLAQSFPDAEERKKLIVVFDSATLLDLPEKLQIRDIRVRFAKGYDSADDLIIEMVRGHAVPKRVLVVSSDHEIQTQVKRRRASFVDSEAWLDQVEEFVRKRDSESPSRPDTKPAPDQSDADHWIEVFSSAEDTWKTQGDPAEMAGKQNAPEVNDDSDDQKNSPSQSNLADSDEWVKQEWEELDDIFPPGYGEDLLD